MKRIALSILTISFLMGCATLGLVGDDPVSAFTKMPPKQKLVVAMDLYNKVYTDTKNTLAATDSTLEQKQVAAEKVKILIKYHQALSVYRMFVEAGTTPSLEDEEALIAFVNELVKKGVSL